MKRTQTLVVLLLLGGGLVSGCATLYGGKLHPSQEHKPQPGEPKRKIRWGMLAADLLGLQLALITIPVDFFTEAVYRPTLPDSTRRAKIRLNRKEKKYVSIGANFLALPYSSAEIASEIRVSPAIGLRISALRTWAGTGQSSYKLAEGVTNQLTMGWSGQAGVRLYPVSIFSPEIRSPAEFYFGADVLATTFE